MAGSPLLDPFAPGVARVPIAFVNAYLVGEPDGPWALVDTGLPKTAGLTRRAAEERFGPGARPEAVVLTHGHFDHAGSALELAEGWDVPIYAHPLELPYLTGRSDYAPKDPTIPGAISFLSRAFPSSGYDFGRRVRALPDGGAVPGLDGWRWIHTPGHTAGHVSLFREADRVLLAGDAVATMDLDSWAAQVVKPRVFNRPPAPFTPDWDAARASVHALAALEPGVVAAGHGLPITDAAAARLRAYDGSVEVPVEHRYGRRPAVADETGIVALPPPVPDPLPLRLAAGLGLAAAATAALRRRRD
jgi:glyoxylase-like metal-dependent hydrolase (beta-lactamase superfamily II)